MLSLNFSAPRSRPLAIVIGLLSPISGWAEPAQSRIETGSDGRLSLRYLDPGLVENDDIRVEGTPSLGSAPFGILSELPREFYRQGDPPELEFPLAPLADRDRFFFRVVKNGPIPTAGFAEAQITISEGTAAPTIPVSFSMPVYGPVAYRIEAAASGETRTGTLQLNGEDFATIPFAIRADDDEPAAPEAYTVSLVAENNSYAGTTSGVSPGLSTTVFVEDNDPLWVGLVQSADGPGLPVALQIRRSNGTTTASLRPDANADVAGFLPDGEHPAASFAWVEGASLDFVSTPIVLPVGAAPPFDSAHSLTIRLAASAGQGQDIVGETEISGQATLETHFQDHPHLNRVSTGRFFLRKMRMPPVGR